MIYFYFCFLAFVLINVSLVHSKLVVHVSFKGREKSSDNYDFSLTSNVYIILIILTEYWRQLYK